MRLQSPCYIEKEVEIPPGNNSHSNFKTTLVQDGYPSQLASQVEVCLNILREPTSFLPNLFTSARPQQQMT